MKKHTNKKSWGEIPSFFMLHFNAFVVYYFGDSSMPSCVRTFYVAPNGEDIKVRKAFKKI